MKVTHIEFSELRSTGYNNARVTAQATVDENTDLGEAFGELSSIVKEALDEYAPKPKPRRDKKEEDIDLRVEQEAHTSEVAEIAETGATEPVTAPYEDPFKDE